MRRSLGILAAVIRAAVLGGLASVSIAVSPVPVAAQDTCLPDAEPNDVPSIATILSGDVCFTGDLPELDQDLAVWEVAPADAATPWTISLSGVEDALTTLDLIAVTSDPGIDPPEVASEPTLRLAVGPDPRDGPPREDVLLPPGRYLVAIYRSNADQGIADASTAYRAGITHGRPMPPIVESEPNDDAATGNEQMGAFEGSGDLATTDDHIHWTPGGAPDTLWQVALRAPQGHSVMMTVTSADGAAWATAYTSDGSAVIHDLAPDPGGYDIALTTIGETTLPYALTTSPEPGGSPADPEPDDQPARAHPIDLTSPVVRGRLATVDDVDLWRFTVDESLAGSLVTIRLIGTDGPSRRLCLQDTTGTPIQCHDGVGGVALTNLLLPAGDYLLAVSGDADPDAPYGIRLGATSAPEADFETEPNDTAILASPFDTSVVMRGSAASGDVDVFRLSVSGEPQLWRIDAQGTGITDLRWVDGDDGTLATGAVSETGANATLSDMYLVPGEHRIAIMADGGEYTLTASPMGPPDPNAEREPNDAAVHANRLELGDARTGHLRAGDDDRYRFSLAATEHIAIDIDGPDTGAIGLELESAGTTIVDTRGGATGQGTHQDIHYDASLPAGDYAIWLSATEPSDDPYRIELRRLDPFAIVGDIEPDDVATAARPLPADGVVTGTGWQVGDPDWFRLPVLAGGELAVRAEGAVASLELVQGDTVVPLVQDGDGATWRTAEAPPGDVLLTLTALGDYTLRVPLATPSTPTAPVLGVELALPVDTVAPWWSAGQRIEGTATITNQTSVAQTATLDTWTSHHDWSASVDPRTLTLEPGATADVPLVIEVAPDAWAGTSVAIAVRAAPGSGPAASGWVTVTPSVDAALVSPHRAWAVPPTLLGGLDVASLAVGGVSDGVMDPVGEAALHDGVAVGGYGLAIPVTDPVSPTTVDLAGDDPVPVTGIIIDPAAGQGLLSTRPRVVELSLSEDGVTWTPALTSEVSPLGIDQAFALPAPVPARYARLAVISTWTLGLLGSDTGFGEADIAEWKVIAAAGVDPVTEPRDIADPVLGGHIVSSQPQFAELPSVTAGMLDADLTPVMAYPGTGDVSWVVGFLHDRAAQVTRIDWQDPDGSDAAQRVKRVAVAVSTGTPLGPWTELGTWQLKRADDGSVAPFVLDAPTWARFVRFTAPGAKDKDAAWELPGRIAVLERPTDDTYRSILAEWGSSQPVGPYELLSPDDDAPPVDDPDVGEGSAAMALDPDTTVGGQVAIGSDVDEYLVRIPDGQHSIRIGARGEPVVGVAVRLFDPDGVEIPLSLAADAGSQVYQANVTSGLTYRVRVEQPPFSAVQMYDTSLSIADYRGPIVEGLTAFAGDVVSGRDHVMVIPFGKTTEPLLDEWSDDAYQLQAVLEGPIPDGGSEVESSVLNALGRLRARAGARAMLLVTDGSTSSFPDGALMWQGLERQRPLVFTVQIGSAPDDPYSTQLLEDLAASSGGVYTYVRTQDEMDRAFDRMATWLRRPVSYRLSYTTSDETLPAPEPGSLSVVTPPGADGEPEPAPVDAHIAIELVLDTSGSMHEQLGKTTRIAAAKQVLERLVRDDLPTGIPVALRWFTLEKQSCDTELAVPLGPLDPDAMTAVIDGITIPSGVRTPLGAAISEVANDLADVTGPRIVVVVTDGRESCGGDPEAAVKALRAQGFDVTVNVVGIGLDKADQKRIRRLAQLGGGTFQDTQGQGQLQDALRAAVAAPVEVYDSTGTLVAKGTVNGPAIEVPPGTYRVVVRTDPVREMDAVVDGGEEVTVTLTP